MWAEAKFLYSVSRKCTGIAAHQRRRKSDCDGVGG